MPTTPRAAKLVGDNQRSKGNCQQEICYLGDATCLGGMSLHLSSYPFSLACPWGSGSEEGKGPRNQTMDFRRAT